MRLLYIVLVFLPLIFYYQDPITPTDQTQTWKTVKYNYTTTTDEPRDWYYQENIFSFNSYYTEIIYHDGDYEHRFLLIENLKYHEKDDSFSGMYRNDFDNKAYIFHFMKNGHLEITTNTGVFNALVTLIYSKTAD